MNKCILTIKVLIALILFASPALSQSSPPNLQNKREADLLELIKLDKTIKLDIRYARSDNFVGKPVYPEARAFLQRPAAEAVLRVHKKLKKQGLGLVIFDGYRPWAITRLFWDVVREDQRKFVANPKTGSRHNRGCAIDLSIYDLKTGKLVDMPSDFDEFTERAHPEYAGGTPEQTANRNLLRSLMEAEGFTVNANEWWHYDYKDWRLYGIYDIAFTAIRNHDELTGYRVRRVEFVGSLNTRGRILFRAIELNEGDLFKVENLYASIDGINKLRKFEPVNDQNISWKLDANDMSADFTIYLDEKNKDGHFEHAKIHEDMSLKKTFDEAGVTGGIAIYDLRKNKFRVYDFERMHKGFAPASTSKIIHSLIFLESGVLKDEFEILTWDGQKRWIDAWNQDHNLRTAYRTSAVWFYVDVSKRMTRDDMQRYYDLSDYGNRSTEGFGQDYWNKGELRITPMQQIKMLVDLDRGMLPFSERTIDIVKDVMIEEKTDKYTLRAKTGWSSAYDPQVGWWVGYVERGNDAYFFATEIDMKKDEDAPKRKEITLNILKKLKIVE